MIAESLRSPQMRSNGRVMNLFLVPSCFFHSLHVLFCVPWTVVDNLHLYCWTNESDAMMNAGSVMMNASDTSMAGCLIRFYKEGKQNSFFIHKDLHLLFMKVLELTYSSSKYAIMICSRICFFLEVIL